MTAFLKLGYLFALGIGLFFLRGFPWLLAALVVQLGLWAHARLGWRPLLRILRKLAFFVAMIVLSYAFFRVSKGQAENRWVHLFFGIEINVDGILLGVSMCMRVLSLVMASTWVQRTGKPGDLARALTLFRLPRSIALSLEGTLALIGGEGRGGGRGGGGGGGGGSGRGRRHRGEEGEDDGLKLADIRSGRLGRLRDHIDRAFRRAERMVADTHADAPPALARDVAVIVGAAVAIMGLKALQVLPGLPIAPGHKNVLMVPIFLLAAQRTRSPLGGLKTGITAGFVSFFLGYGKYGVLEVSHFAAPGLLADLLRPVLGGRTWRLGRLMLVGGLLGLSRFTANFLVVVMAGAPWAAFVAYTPMLASQVVFGVLSGFVSLLVLSGPDEAAPARSVEDAADPSKSEDGGTEVPGAATTVSKE